MIHNHSQRLAKYLLQYRTTVHPTTNATPCMLLMNCPLCTRLDLLCTDVERRVVDQQDQQAKYKASHDSRSCEKQFFLLERE